MKSWLIKFRISAAIDSGKPLPEGLRKAIAQSGELSQFEERTRALDRRLLETRPQPEPLPFLHQAIMRSVAESSGMGPSRPQRWRLGWLAAPALAALLAVGLWWAFKPASPPPDAQALAAVSSTLETGSEMTRTAAADLLAPLSDELDRVNHDLDHTAQFLLSSVP